MITQLDRLSNVDRILLARKRKGFMKRVADAERVNPSLVSRVYYGQATSRRIKEAIERELFGPKRQAAENAA